MSEVLDELIEADAAHERELADDPGAREERDAARKALFELIQAVRGGVEANYADLGLRTLGLWEPCPPNPQGTLTYARNLVAALRATPKLPESRTPHLKVDRAALANDLETLSERLDRAIRAVAHEEAEAKGTQARKDAAMAAYDAVFRETTSLAIGFFRLAGLATLAERIRPSRRGPGVLENPQPPADADPNTPVNGA